MKVQGEIEKGREVVLIDRKLSQRLRVGRGSKFLQFSTTFSTSQLEAFGNDERQCWVYFPRPSVVFCLVNLHTHDVKIFAPKNSFKLK